MTFKILSISLLITISLAASVVLATEPDLVTSQELRSHEDSKGVLYQQTNGPFAVMVFNEFALGEHIGVIYYSQMANPADGKWWISQRFWQARPWNEDVTSFAWDNNGKFLYVATSGVYGDGGLFRLDLHQKTYARLHPTKKEGLKEISSTEIVGIDQTSRTLDVLVTLADEKTTKSIKISTK